MLVKDLNSKVQLRIASATQKSHWKLPGLSLHDSRLHAKPLPAIRGFNAPNANRGTWPWSISDFNAVTGFYYDAGDAPCLSVITQYSRAAIPCGSGQPRRSQFELLSGKALRTGDDDNVINLLP